MRILTTALGLLAALTACQLDSPPPHQHSGALAAQLQALAQRMHQRYAGAHRLQEAIVRSDLDRVHAEAHAMSMLDEPDVLPQWRPYFEAVAETARAIEASGDVVAAGNQLAELGARCARCHEAASAKLVLPAPPRPGSGASRMAEHAQAAFTMWEGLMAPSDERWRAGAQALTAVPLTMVAQAATPSFDHEIDDVARVRLYARRALDAGDRATRADVFGSLLGTCARCHAALRDR